MDLNFIFILTHSATLLTWSAWVLVSALFNSTQDHIFSIFIKRRVLISLSNIWKHLKFSTWPKIGTQIEGNAATKMIYYSKSHASKIIPVNADLRQPWIDIYITQEVTESQSWKNNLTPILRKTQGLREDVATCLLACSLSGCCFVESRSRGNLATNLSYSVLPNILAYCGFFSLPTWITG